MVVLAELCMVDAPASGHAEVEDHRVVAVGMDQAVFGAAPKPGDSGTRQPLAEVLGKRTSQVRPPHLDPRDPPAIQHALETAYGRFDFR